MAEASPTEQLDRLDDTRLETECKKLDPAEERHLAEEGLAGDSWPEDCEATSAGATSTRSAAE